MVSVTCAQGSGSALSDGGGHYSIVLNATLPYILTVTSVGAVLHSLAFNSGTFNTTPEAELMLVYLASQFGTTESSLIADFPGNSQFQPLPANRTNALVAQSAVVVNLQQRYSVTLAAQPFLTTPFIVGSLTVAPSCRIRPGSVIRSLGCPDTQVASPLR